MNAIVVFSSQTGNTEKLARTIIEELDAHAEAYTVDVAPPPDGYDFLAIGFWLQGGKPDPKSAAYLAKIKPTQSVFLFATHGAAPDSEHARHAMDQAESLVGGATVLGTFNCCGQVNPKLLEKVQAKPSPPIWIDNADKAVGHPDNEDLEKLRSAVRALAF
jgi:flavodoxin